MKHMKFPALLTAAVLLLTTTACGKTQKTGATMDISLDHSYTAVPVTYDGAKGAPYPVLFTEDAVYLQYSEEKGCPLVRWYPDTGVMEEVTLHEGDKKGTDAGVLYALPDDHIGVLYNNTSINTTTWTADGCSLSLSIYDSDMQYLESVPLDFTCGNWGLQSQTTAVDSEGRWYYSYNDTNGVAHLVTYTADYQPLCEFDLGSRGVSRVFSGTDGTVYALLWSESVPYAWVQLVPETGELRELSIEGMPEYPDFCDGVSGTYVFCVKDREHIYGVTLDGSTGSVEPLMNFWNSDFSSGELLQVHVLPDNRFLLLESIYASTDGVSHLYLATERTQEEKDAMQLITLAGVKLPNLLTNAVCSYNRSQSDVRIVMKDYATEEDMYDYTYASGVEALKQELLAGNVPDILCTDNLPFDRLANKGLFADLAPLLKKDERFSEEDYYMNFFDSLCYGGKQQRIAFSYTVMTNIAKTEFVGEQQGRSSSEFMDMVTNLPDGMTVYPDMTREDATNLMRWVQGTFIDTEKRTCSFDSPEFTALLELAGSLQPQDYESVGSITEYYAAYPNHKALLYSTDIYRPINFHEIHSGVFWNEPVTLVGYPTTSGNGGVFCPTFTLSMNTQSVYETEIMDFFMELLGEDYQRNVCMEDVMHDDSLPVLRSALEEDCAAATKGANRTYYMGSEVNTGNATEEEMAQLLAYIEGITVSRFQDYTIQNVIEEEAEMFYAGDQTAEETAKMIQSRVGLYLSE